MFITFEGLDFCGKSTQVKLLETYLRNQGKIVELTREPGGTDISEQIRTILLNKKNNGMVSKSELLLFNSARIQLIEEFIKPKLKKGIYVISDRFYDSSEAYQGFGRGIDLKFVDLLRSFVLGDLIPKRTYFLDMSLDELNKRKAKFAKNNLDRIESSNDKFYERVRTGYLEIVKREPSRVKIIDGTKSIDEIHKIIKTDIYSIDSSNEQ